MRLAKFAGIWLAGLICEILAFSVDVYALNKHLPSYGYDTPLKLSAAGRS